MILQYLITIIDPAGNAHQFVLPPDYTLKRLYPEIIRHLDLPLDAYHLVDINGQSIPPHASIAALFPTGEGSVCLLTDAEWVALTAQPPLEEVFRLKADTSSIFDRVQDFIVAHTAFRYTC